MTNKPKKRVVKAWAVINNDGKIDPAMVDGCDCSTTDALGIYPYKEEAKKTVWDNTKVVPCTITYQVTKK